MLETLNEGVLWTQYTFYCLALNPYIPFKAVNKVEGQWLGVEVRYVVVRAYDCLHIPQMW